MDEYRTTPNDNILKNGQLFNAIRKNKPQEEKLKKIQKYLKQGADINAADANDRNNAPLHIAVLRGEMQVIKFLLDNGADIDKRNGNNHTALDIAKLLRTSDGNAIQSILEECNSNKYHLQEIVNVPSERIKKDFEDTKNDTVALENEGSVSINALTKPSSKEYVYRKRGGTSGLSGQLYESKLLSLILFRALHKHITFQFFLGTNVDGMGAFDDIVFKYNIKGKAEPTILFLQAKHKDDPAKDKLTVEEVLKPNGDFSLHKYLDSYIKISQNISPDSSDEVLKGIFNNIDCHFIIYTSAEQKFTKKKVIQQCEEQHFIKATDKGEVFQIEYDDQDIKLLVQSLLRSRISLLAKTLMKYVLRNNNCNTMLKEDVLKTYHVFLAQNVLVLECASSGKSQFVGRFRESFLDTEDTILLILKECICKEVAVIQNKTLPFQQDDIENVLKSITFDIPQSFGNANFVFIGKEKKRQQQLNDLCIGLKKLCQNGQSTEIDSTEDVIKIDNTMIGPNKILTGSDLDLYRLESLVGHILIFDDQTKMLKFNMEEHISLQDSFSLREKLKEDAFLGERMCNYRLDISLHSFPKLTLVQDERDKQLVSAFLNNLKFYTNQAKEDVVEKTVIDEIDKHYNAKGRNDTLFRLKAEAIFLKVHDKIQKWGRKSKSAPYLTESCTFYYEAEQEILDSPLLNILNYIYRQKLKEFSFKFNDSTVESLNIETFLNDDTKVLHIITNESKFTAIKLTQYFENTNHEKDYLFIDMDFVTTGNYFDSVIAEIKKLKACPLIIICEDNSNSNNLNKKINLLIQTFEGKVIIVAKDALAQTLHIDLAPKYIINTIDKNNNFNNLIPKVRQKILQQNIIYQGTEISLGDLIDEESTCFLDSNILRDLVLGHNKVVIGETVRTPAYIETVTYYVQRHLCRYITLKKNVQIDNNNIIVADSPEELVSVPNGITDIVLFAKNKDIFDRLCSQYSDLNVHYFNKSYEYIWQKSQGSLRNIMKYLNKDWDFMGDQYVTTLKDLDEKVVIISAEPGMGKSTFLTHAAVETKDICPTLWIARINLNEHFETFSKWKDNDTKLDFKVAMTFVLSAIDIKAFKDIKGNKEKTEKKIKILDNIIQNIIDTGTCFKEEPNKDGIENLSGLEILEIQLFYHLYKKNQVALLLDGFDEICPDYAHQVLDLINILKTTEVVHLWITSRSYNVLNQLEGSLGIFSFSLRPLLHLDQYLLVTRVWTRNLVDGSYSHLRINTFSRALVDKITGNMGGDTNFTRIPLHLFMIAEIFESDFQEVLNSESNELSLVYQENSLRNINLFTLYKQFVELKFMKIRFGEKKPFLCLKDPDMRKVIEGEYAIFIARHKKVSAYYILDRKVASVLLTEQDMKDIRATIDDVRSGAEKTGIIEHVLEKEPKFIHMTFAEHFATLFLYDKLTSDSCDPLIWKYLVDIVHDKGGMRRFLDSMLSVNQHLINLTSNENYMSTVYITLLSQGDFRFNSLYIAFQEALQYLAIFLLKCIENVLNKENVGTFLKFIQEKCEDMYPFQDQWKLKRNKLPKCSCDRKESLGITYERVDLVQRVTCTMCSHLKTKIIKYLFEIVKKIVEENLVYLYYCEDIEEFQYQLSVSDINEHRIDYEFTVENLLRYGDRFRNTFYLIHLHGSNFIGEDNFYLLFKNARPALLKALFFAIDSFGKLLAHYVAKLNDYVFFDAASKLLSEEQFKRMCLTYDFSGCSPFFYFDYNNLNFCKFADLFTKVYEVDYNSVLVEDRKLFVNECFKVTMHRYLPEGTAVSLEEQPYGDVDARFITIKLSPYFRGCLLYGRLPTIDPEKSSYNCIKCKPIRRRNRNEASSVPKS